MVKHITFGSKTFATSLRARKWSLVQVYPLVDLEVLLFAETFATLRKFALERLCTIVKMQVSIQSDSSFKNFVAAIMRTLEALL